MVLKLSQKYGIDENLQFIISALVASLTVGGKAIGKGIAQKNTTKIVGLVSKILNVVYK